MALIARQSKQRRQRAIDERQRAREIILEIIQAAGGRFEGKTRLFKAFLIAHLFHVRDNERILSDWPIVHMPKGHGIDDADALLRELVQEGSLEISSQFNGPFPEACYSLARPAKTTLDSRAKRAIKKTARFIKNKSATELSELIHEKSRSYKLGKSGKELSIYIDLIDDEEFEWRQAKLRSVSRAVGRIFSE